jgi:hypothetical protein
MRRDILEKIIDEKIKSVPDFSHVEDKAKLLPKPRKTRHAPVLKRVLALFLGVLVISCAVLGAVKLVGDGGYTVDGDGQSAGNVGDAGEGDSTGGEQIGGGGSGGASSISIPLPFMAFEFSLSAVECAFGETFTVTLSIRPTGSEVRNGPLTVTIGESEYFEIIGESQYIVEDYAPRTEGSPYDYGGEKYVQAFTFTVKPIAEAPYIDSLNFYVDFSLSEVSEWFEKDQRPYSKDTDGHTACYRVLFMTDSQGVMLAPNAYDARDLSLVYHDKVAAYDLFNKVMDRRYANGEVTLYEYVAMYRLRSVSGAVNIDAVFEDGALKRINYTSYCFTAQIEISEEFLLSDDYLVLIDLLRRNDTESQVACAKMVIDMVRDATELSDERYEAALAVLENKKITKKVLSTKYSFIEEKLAIQNISKYFYEFKINV